MAFLINETRIRIARIFWVFIIIGPLSILFLFHAETLADKIENTSSGSGGYNAIQQELTDGFDWRLKIVGSGKFQQPKHSLVNYNNRLGINRYESNLDFRPDFSLAFRNLLLDVKPRLNLEWKWWQDGKRDGEDDFDHDLFIHEWLARYMVTPELFLSYGREDLQWGPSYLISPSNPFSKTVRRDTPWIETPEMDYGKAVWIPSAPWTVSIVAKIDKGRADDVDDFEKQFAMKTDYIGPQVFLSLIPSIDEIDNWNVGFYGGWNANDATLLYGEGNAADDDFDFLIGAAYTLEMGPIISLEYYYNQNGCTDPFHECLLSQEEVTKNDILKRENYLLVQFIDTRIYDKLNIIVRWVMGLDDNSDRSTAIFEYELGDHAKIFTNGNYYHGGGDSEFGSFFKYSVTAGIEYNF